MIKVSTTIKQILEFEIWTTGTWDTETGRTIMKRTLTTSISQVELSCTSMTKFRCLRDRDLQAVQYAEKTGQSIVWEQPNNKREVNYE